MDSQWITSSRCDSGGCVEVAGWETSSACSGGNCMEVACSGGECLEAGCTEGIVYVRDSKNRDGGTLRFSRAAWLGFVQAVTDGDLPEI